MKKWILEQTEKFRLWLYWKDLSVKDLLIMSFSFLWLFIFIVFTGFALWR